ncbi:MAG: hypothetical protein HYX79_08720 [Chloroflexi bacterium]|nr:hypothetical protein [Chloroflexota bacterium]
MEDAKTQQDAQLKKLQDIASDTGLPSELRYKAMEQLGRVGSHEALVSLLELVANEKLARQEREAALKYVAEILKSKH